MCTNTTILVFTLIFQRGALIHKIQEEVVNVTLTLDLKELMVEEGATIDVYLLEVGLEVESGVGKEISAADGDELPGDGD